MSGYYYPPHSSPQEEEDEFDFRSFPTTTMAMQSQQVYGTYSGPSYQLPVSQHQYYGQPMQQYVPQYQQQPQQWNYMSPPMQQQAWNTPTVPSNVVFSPQQVETFPRYAEPPSTTYASSPEMAFAGPSRTSTGYLSPGEGRSRVSRTTSLASEASSRGDSQSDVSRSVSPSAGEMMKWGRRNRDGTWNCAYPGCTSRSSFSRGCDLRKHYKRHTKSLFCRHQGCPQATEGGFSSKKDRARHEAKHDPQIECEWEDCNRLFSRVDNMVRPYSRQSAPVMRKY